MGLSYVTPVVVNGENVAKLDKKEVDRATEEWQNALIVYVIGQNPSLMAITNYCKSQWAPKVEPKIFKHDEGYFVVKMDTAKDRDAVLYSGPHLFFGKAMIVKQWTSSFSFNQEILKVVPIWVTFPNLPLNCWSTDSLSRIGSTIGVPIYADECTTKQLRISFARILIEMDVTGTIQEEINVEDPNRRVFKQKVGYAWLPPFCAKCQKIGHVCEEKKKPTKGRIIQKWVPVGQAKDISSSNPRQELDEEGAWKLVTRKTKDKEKQGTFQTAKTAVMYELQSGGGSSAAGAGGAKGPNPYLS
ncbi:uncharacterized protein LOC125494690 [Beta vulgaris subsp. vulgaris]|uniref:uncharacterized protein LOC125494690 n=1 Tax=Beta vulgaris subsp. vulgaris TaxID=3555 RepID=UPI0020366E27|nr:uncharacterized protein LOC125494690 [Beta vulgaris subsp. vulgaris]